MKISILKELLITLLQNRTKKKGYKETGGATEIDGQSKLSLGRITKEQGIFISTS